MSAGLLNPISDPITEPVVETPPVSAARRPASSPIWVHLLLSLLTLFTTTALGMRYMVNFNQGKPPLASSEDIVAHVYSWQKISLVRMEAAVLNQGPTFPEAPCGFDLDTENDVDGINAWFYETYRDHPWPTIHQNWRAGFLRLLELADGIPERELLDSSRYPWLKGHPLAFVLVASYDHHQEHLDGLRAWLQQHD